jgi:hypothetical protein
MLQSISSPRGEAASPPLQRCTTFTKVVTETDLQLHGQSCSRRRYPAVTLGTLQSNDGLQRYIHHARPHPTEEAFWATGSFQSNPAGWVTSKMNPLRAVPGWVTSKMNSVSSGGSLSSSGGFLGVVGSIRCIWLNRRRDHLGGFIQAWDAALVPVMGWLYAGGS